MKESGRKKSRSINKPEGKHQQTKQRKELNNSLTLFEGFAGSLPIGLYVVQSGKFEYVNHKFEEILGYNKEELIGTDSLNYVYPEDREAVRVNAARMLKRENITGFHPYEYRVICKSGESKWIMETVVTTKYKGKLATLGYFMDITERKRIENVLWEEKAFAKGIIATAQTIILVLDTEGRIVEFNPYLEEISGYRLNELQGEDWFDTFLPEDIRTRVRTLFKQAISDIQTKGYVNPIMTKDGRELYIEWYDKTLKDVDGTIIGLLAIGHDITERKQAEETIRNSEENFRRSIEESPLGIRIVNSEGDTLYANRAFLDMWGYSTIEELEETSHQERYTPEDYIVYQERVAKRQRGESVPADYEVKIRRKNGEVRHLAVSRRDIIWNGRPQFQTIYQDLTDRKKAEETIKLSEARLESLLRISQYKADTTREFLDFALDEAIKLTGSKIGYIYFYDEAKKEFTLNSWSRDVIQECTIVNPQTIYQLDKTGVWGEVVRQRKPIIINDYQSPNPLKKGYPEGHSKLYRWMSVPIFTGERIAAVVGIANKFTDYDHADVRQLTLLMDSVWKYVDRKKAEEALRDSEQRFREMFEKHLAVMLLIEPQSGRIVDVNAAAAEYYGYPRETLRNMNINEINQLPSDEVAEARQTAVKKQGNYFIFLHRLASGEIRIVEVRSSPIKVGSQTLLFSIIHDITERKQAEEALKQSEEKYRTILKIALDGFTIDDLDGRLLEVNDSYCKITGYTREELLAFSISDIDVEENTKETTQHLKKIVEQGYDRFETKHKRKDGKIIDLEISANYVDMGGGQLFVSVRDITERKQAEEALQQERDKLELVTSSVGVGLAIISKDYHTLWANKVLRDIFGDVNGKPCYLTYNKQPDICPECGVKQIFETGKDIAVHEQVGKDAKGNVIWSQIVATPLKDKDGNITAALEAVIPITDRKKAEESANKSRQELRNLYRRLQTLREEERAQVAGTLHDELGQAMTALKMDLSGVAKRLPKGEMALLGKIASMSELTDTILGTVRKISTELRPGLLDDLGLVAAIEWQADEFAKRSSINYNCTSSSPDIKVDRDKSTAIFRIFQELLTNIGRHARASVVMISITEKSDIIELKVMDNGIGIPEEAINSNKSFGLIGIRERANAFGGDVTFTGIPGKGTTVTVQIPLKETNIDKDTSS